MHRLNCFEPCGSGKWASKLSTMTSPHAHTSERKTEVAVERIAALISALLAMLTVVWRYNLRLVHSH